MKNVASFVLILAGFFAATEALSCKSNQYSIPQEWLTMDNPCIESMKKQIQTEVNASMHYLTMGAYFSRDIVNRPGFAKMFFEAASEERQHAMKLIEYLLMRTEVTGYPNIKSLIKLNVPERQEWKNGADALETALKLESQVTKDIRDVIIKCEKNSNDYHLVDYLTGEFLEEQYKGQRDIAGKLSTLSKMMNTNGALGEFLFDKKLIKGEIF